MPTEQTWERMRVPFDFEEAMVDAVFEDVYPGAGAEGGHVLHGEAEIVGRCGGEGESALFHGGKGSMVL